MDREARARSPISQCPAYALEEEKEEATQDTTSIHESMNTLWGTHGLRSSSRVHGAGARSSASRSSSLPRLVAGGTAMSRRDHTFEATHTMVRHSSVPDRSANGASVCWLICTSRTRPSPTVTAIIVPSRTAIFGSQRALSPGLAWKLSPALAIQRDKSWRVQRDEVLKRVF